MPTSPLRFETPVDAVRAGFEAIRRELEIDVDFPAAATAEASESATRGPAIAAVRDQRAIPFVSIDPRGSRDLDQALHIARAGDGFVVHYAIADVAAFVSPGGPIDTEACRRGVTVYFPDVRAPLHPTVLSEGAASLLPGEDRQALVWRFDLDGDGETRSFSMERALVRNRYAYAYDEAQARLGAGAADDTITNLAVLGPRLQAREVARGGVSLGTPEQLVVHAAGRFELVYRAPLPVEAWNAQISLLTGVTAGGVMLDAGVGVLRTLPEPDGDARATFRRHARALQVPWPRDMSYGDFIRCLDPLVPDHAALLAQAARLFRGAGYVAFDVASGVPAPTAPAHAAVAAPYAHVTAPLRRLVDRFANEVVLAACSDTDLPPWVRDALPALPDAMAAGRQRESQADARVADLVEAAVLAGRIGDVLDAVVVRMSDRGAQVQIRHPAVVAAIDAGGVSLGDEVRVRVDAADPADRRVQLTVVA